jgi:archaellum component FlaC
MKIETIEILLVCLIVSIQLWVFIRTLIQIKVFRKIIPKVTSLKISKVLVPVVDLERLSPKDILAKLPQYNNIDINFSGESETEVNFENHSNSLFIDNSEAQTINADKIEVNIVQCDSKKNHVLDNILFSVNNYLIRNRGASSDFNLIKDIVERNTNAVEEDINISIGIPLYLGLMGTMLGIVIGLFNMPDLGVGTDSKANDLLLNDGIGLLIGGVKIAMIASFSGLLFTIFNSGWAFKGARILVESRKNDFYTFIQIELLPIINQGLASTLESLQRNLMKFNGEFTSNLSQLSGIFESNSKTIKGQKELLDAIDKTKVAEMTKYNVKVLQQLDISVGQFEKFNHSFVDLNNFVENTHNLVSKSNEFLSRTDNLQVIAAKIESKLDESQQLIDFLSKHFHQLESHKKFITDSVAEVGYGISDTFKELKDHIENSSKAIKDFTVEELDALKTALSESKTNLSNLEHLTTITKDILLFKNGSASQLEKLNSEIENNNKVLQQISSDINSLVTTTKNRGIAASISNLWKWITAKK